MSNPGILPGFGNIPAQKFGRVVLEYRYPNHQFNTGDLGKTLVLQYQSGLAAAFYLPHDNQCFFEPGSILSGYNAGASQVLTITPRTGVSVYIIGRSNPVSTINIIARAQFTFLKDITANIWLASGTGIY